MNRINSPTKPKHWLVLLIIAVFALLVYFGLRQQQIENQGETSADTNQPQLGEQSDFNSLDAGASPSNFAQPPAQRASSTLTRDQKLDLAPNYMNVPVSFYGRVVDQNGNPLSGVRVILSVRQWYRPTASAGLNSIFSKTELITDVAGYFQLASASGDSLRIETLEKEGYEPEPKSLRGFTYTSSNPMRPDQSNPIIFRMWKIEAKQSLVTGDKFLPIIPDGRVYTLDLSSGAFAEGEYEGDLRIAIKRAPDAAWGKRYEWFFELTAINGGLAEETNTYESMYLAPEENYNKTVAMSFRPGEGWTYGISKRFYIKARNGQLYGRMDLEIQAYYLKDKQGRFGLKYAVNPNGSRILR